MKLPEPFSWSREEARSGKFDGKFLIGVRTTGIYCLPSCPTHPPKKENVTLYRTEAECIAAGLRACKRCRPDLFYRGEDENIALFEGLAARVRGDIAGFAELPLMRDTVSARRLLHVGQLVERKGLERFLRALTCWAETHPDLRRELWFLGDGPLRHKLRSTRLPANLKTTARRVVQCTSVK